MRRNAAIVPHTEPRYVTSVTRRNSSGASRVTGAYTVTIALLTQTSTGAELGLDPLGRGLERLGLGDVERKDQRAPAARLDLLHRGLQALLPPRDQRNRIALLRKAAGGRPADAGRRAVTTTIREPERATGVDLPGPRP
jgi:hypothetical protein